MKPSSWITGQLRCLLLSALALGAGQYPANESVPQAPQSVCFNPLLVLAATGLATNFSTPASWPIPIAVQLSDTCGKVVGNARVVLTFSDGDPALPLAANSGTGIYAGTWTPRHLSSRVVITASATAAGYQAASVELTGQAIPPVMPVLAPDGVAGIFNPRVGAGFAPGGLIRIYGSGLASQSSAAPLMPLPTAIGGTTVLIGGIEAPLSHVSPEEIDAQIPFELKAGTNYLLIVSANGAMTLPESIRIDPEAPAIVNFSSGDAVAEHPDGTPVLDSFPAAPGESIAVYLTGLGVTEAPVASGAPSPSNPLARIVAQPTLTLNGDPVVIVFAGLVPGLVGLYQIDFQVPTSLAAGRYDLMLLTQSGAASNKAALPVR